MMRSPAFVRRCQDIHQARAPAPPLVLIVIIKTLRRRLQAFVVLLLCVYVEYLRDSCHE
jgi:hypothetical protein